MSKNVAQAKKERKKEMKLLWAAQQAAAEPSEPTSLGEVGAACCLSSFFGAEILNSGTQAQASQVELEKLRNRQLREKFH